MNRRIELLALARQFFKFGIVGGVGFVVDSILLHIGIAWLHLDPFPAALFSFPFAVCTTRFGNRVFTFREIAHEPPLQQLRKFAGVCAVGLIFNRGAMYICLHEWPFAYAHPQIALVIGTAAGMFFNFFVARRHVFR